MGSASIETLPGYSLYCCSRCFPWNSQIASVAVATSISLRITGRGSRGLFPQDRGESAHVWGHANGTPVLRDRSP